MKRLTTLALLAGMLSAPALHSEEPGSGSAAPLSFPQLNDAADSEPGDEPPAASLAETHPLPASETVGDLEANINRLLTHFHWGVVTIDVGEDGLRLRHQALPVSRDEAGRVRWCNAFCAILEGLYSRWLQSQGGSAHVILQRERVFSVSDVQFLYYHP